MRRLATRRPERPSLQLERQIETPQTPRKISSHLRACLDEQRVARFTRAQRLGATKSLATIAKPLLYDQQIAAERRRYLLLHRGQKGRHASLCVRLRNGRALRDVPMDGEVNSWKCL